MFVRAIKTLSRQFCFAAFVIVVGCSKEQPTSEPYDQRLVKKMLLPEAKWNRLGITNPAIQVSFPGPAKEQSVKSETKAGDVVSHAFIYEPTSTVALSLLVARFPKVEGVDWSKVSRLQMFENGVKAAMDPSSRLIERKSILIGNIEGMEVAFTKGNALITWRGYWLPPEASLVQLITVTHQRQDEQDLWRPVMEKFFDSLSIEGHTK